VNGISLPTSCLLNKSVVREALRGLVRETLALAVPPRQTASLAVLRALIASGSLLYVSPELWHILERPANRPLASPVLPSLRVLTPGRYLKRWCRRLTQESFTHEDALILSYASFGFDELEETFGVEAVLTNDLRMKARYDQDFPRIRDRFLRMIRALKSPYHRATLPEVLSAAEVHAQLAF
jgi:hypothetical protein